MSTNSRIADCLQQTLPRCWLSFAVWLIPYACAQLYQPCSGGHEELFHPCWLSGVCRTFEMLVDGLTESKSRGKNVFRVAPQSHNPFLQGRILSLAPELFFDRPRKNTGCFAVYQTSHNLKIYDTDTFVMRKPQLADCPFGICKRLATKKSYSILWPPWKATRSLLRTYLLFRGNAFKNGMYAPCLSEHCTKSQSKTNGHDPGSSLQKKKTHSCKWIQNRLGFWIPRRGFQIPGAGFLIFFQ